MTVTILPPLPAQSLVKPNYTQEHPCLARSQRQKVVNTLDSRSFGRQTRTETTMKKPNGFVGKTGLLVVLGAYPDN